MGPRLHQPTLASPAEAAGFRCQTTTEPHNVELAGVSCSALILIQAPSCAYAPAWACPLAPAGNTVDVEVPVGELQP